MDTLVELLKNYPTQISAMVALCALLVSFASILLTFITLWWQRRHYFKSLTPIADIYTGDYEDELAVRVENTGVGPLIVENFVASDGNKKLKAIIDFMPEEREGISWSTFRLDIDGECIPPNKELALIRLRGDPNDESFASFRDDVRRELSKLTVTLKYRDIYNRKMPIKQRDFEWFARQLGA